MRLLPTFFWKACALLALLALAACDRQEANALTQAGAWRIVRVSTQADGTPATATTVENPGELSFTNYDGVVQYDRVTLYLDQAIPSVLVAGPGIFYRGYQPDRHERHRVILVKVNDDRPDDVFIYTLTEDGADRQRWLLLTSRNDQITYREEWELERL